MNAVKSKNNIPASAMGPNQLGRERRSAMAMHGRRLAGVRFFVRGGGESGGGRKTRPPPECYFTTIFFCANMKRQNILYGPRLAVRGSVTMWPGPELS